MTFASLSFCGPAPSQPPFLYTRRNQDSQGACICLYHPFKNVFMPISIDRPKIHYLDCPAYLILPIPRVLCRRIHLPVSLFPLYLVSHIFTAAIIQHPSPPPTFSSISIIPNIYRASIVILPRLCCVPHCIVFRSPVSFATVICPHSPASLMCLPSPPFLLFPKLRPITILVNLWYPIPLSLFSTPSSSPPLLHPTSLLSCLLYPLPFSSYAVIVFILFSATVPMCHRHRSPSRFICLLGLYILLFCAILHYIDLSALICTTFLTL